MALKLGTQFKRTIKNPTTGQDVSDTVYTVMENSKKLSEQKIISSTSTNAGPLEDSLAILSALGMTVVEETQEINATILTDKFLDTNKLEKLTNTRSVGYSNGACVKNSIIPTGSSQKSSRI